VLRELAHQVLWALGFAGLGTFWGNIRSLNSAEDLGHQRATAGRHYRAREPMRKDVREFIRRLEAAGLTVSQRRAITTFSATASH
jgi:hypothetical protein